MITNPHFVLALLQDSVNTSKSALRIGDRRTSYWNRVHFVLEQRYISMKSCYCARKNPTERNGSVVRPIRRPLRLRHGPRSAATNRAAPDKQAVRKRRCTYPAACKVSAWRLGLNGGIGEVSGGSNKRGSRCK